MGRVILGAIVGAILVGLLGALAKNFDATFTLNNLGPGGGFQSVSLAKVMGAIGVVIGVAAGGIIGAIAGAVSARPESRPISVWFWLILLALVILTGAVGAYAYLMRDVAPQPRIQQEEGPVLAPQKKDAD